MTNGTEKTGYANIQFFGKMVASLSHEIKNVFAIIHENAGLLEDLIVLSEKGMPLDPERLKGLSKRMRDQIIRGNKIVQNMNRFAHSADEPIENIDLNQTLQLLRHLFERPVAMKGIVLETKDSENEVTIRTNPFVLENMLWLCVNAAMDSMTVSKKMVLAGEEAGDSARIRVSGLDAMPETLEANIKRGTGEMLLKELNGTLTVDSKTGALILNLPKSIS
ncbi:MAG: HAMP domain-containing histidine kinase [Deltaproteobacteria bacterium]|nr:HAMP domain-containing histidine kinase [Deltaproteobacteria bacterium]